MTTDQQDSIDRAVAVIEFVALAIPELERADLLTEQTAFAAYALLSGAAADLATIGGEHVSP